MKRRLVEFVSDAASWLNRILPKRDRVLIQGYPNIEPSAVEVANKVVELKDIKVYYVVSGKSPDRPDKLLHPEIKTVRRESLSYFYFFLTSKYIFFTHGAFLKKLSSSQVVVNIWHGLPYKKIRKMVGGEDLVADYTVGTSYPTKKIFSESFGVPEASVVTTGYPRNEQLMRAQGNRDKILSKADPTLLGFKNLMIWLPTYRKNTVGLRREDGQEIGNPFYIKDFDVEHFNKKLREENSFCIVKPHPMAIKYHNRSLSNLLFIDDQWLSQRGITLYDLVGCTDFLISDVSSIILDYLLLDRPILCVSTDFDAYGNTRGVYFQDIENWIPAKVCRNQQEFFIEIEEVVFQKRDLYQEKRNELRDYFFKGNKNSTEDLINIIFKNGAFKR